MESLVKIDTSISESCRNMIKYLDSLTNDNASEVHRFIDRFASLIFGSDDRRGWLFSCKSPQDSHWLYSLLSPGSSSSSGSLFKKSLRQAGNRAKEFQIVLERLPSSIRRKIVNCTDASALGSVFRDHVQYSKDSIGSKLLAENVHLRYDTFEYLIFRFLLAPTLASNGSPNQICYDPFLVAFVWVFGAVAGWRLKLVIGCALIVLKVVHRLWFSDRIVFI